MTLRWKKHCILAVAVVESDDGDSNDIIVPIKDAKLNIPVVILSGKDNQKPSKLLSKGFVRSVYCNEYTKNI